MGIKDLWTILTPYCERKPIHELQGKVIAIDLAGWVCESLNVVDYFVHPRQYLKNLFFRTCYLLLEDVTPVFVLEGTAPKLKERIISKRNELQFRGAKPRNLPCPPEQVPNNAKPNECKGRTKFNYVLKQCETLLQSMGLQCVQGPGEAEAYCSFLNKKGLVEGVISQDSDCFAYGAIKVYRNFSVSTQGKNHAQGGAVDVYDMNKIKKCMDIGQNKIIVMALLSGCDYCPEGIGGIGKDSVLKLFARYKNDEILERVRLWRSIINSYTSLEMKANDNNICSNCGHLGKTQSHTRSGCQTCHTKKGCDASLWRDERNSIRSELMLRQKALTDPDFPSEDIIKEFLTQPEHFPKLPLEWRLPNLVQFVRKIGSLLQWTEIYCVQKFLPLLTRWLITNHGKINENLVSGYVTPKFIKKKRTVKGVPSYEIVWEDKGKFFDGLIPGDQLKAYMNENPLGLELLWSTIEPQDYVKKSNPEIVRVFFESKQKKSKSKKATKSNIVKQKNINVAKSDSLQDMSAIFEATEEIEKKVKKKQIKIKGIQKIDKFLIYKNNTPLFKKVLLSKNCSTPKGDISFISNLDSENENDFDFSQIIETITSKPAPLNRYEGKKLIYGEINVNGFLNTTKDDLALLPRKRNITIMSPIKISKKVCMNKSVELLDTSAKLYKTLSDSCLKQDDKNNFDSFKTDDCLDLICNEENNCNVSYFFTNVCDGIDEFEKSFNLSFL